MHNNSIKKILMTADTIGGVWTYALDLCRSLSTYGIDVHLATMGKLLSYDQKTEAATIENLTVYESSFKLEWMDDPWEDVEKAGEWLLGLEEQIRPDLIHLNNYTHGNLPWNKPVIVVAHSCVLSWWEAVKREPAPPSWNKYKSKVKAGLQTADAVVGISRNYFEILRKIYGPFKDETIIYNGRPASHFYSQPKQDQVFAMGRVWDEAKNLQVLGKIAEQSAYPIVIAGNNLHPVEGEAIDIPHVSCLGQVDQREIADQLATSLIYVLPAKYEPFGLSALEAALSRCLLVLSDIPTLREIWQDSALYFDPEDPWDLLKQLEWAHEFPEEREALVLRSYERAQRFSLQRMGEKYMELYNKVGTDVYHVAPSML